MIFTPNLYHPPRVWKGQSPGMNLPIVVSHSALISWLDTNQRGIPF